MWTSASIYIHLPVCRLASTDDEPWSKDVVVNLGEGWHELLEPLVHLNRRLLDVELKTENLEEAAVGSDRQAGAGDPSGAVDRMGKKLN